MADPIEEEWKSSIVLACLVARAGGSIEITEEEVRALRDYDLVTWEDPRTLKLHIRLRYSPYQRLG